MGILFGAYDTADYNLERPDLNKCPDCGCFFAQDACPLCGKICPEEMRAGNRKPVKQKKVRRNRSSGRVTFVEWYHSWWFIILMLFISRFIGIILLATSPHKRSQKITVIVIAVAISFFSYFGIGNLFMRLTNMWDNPVDTSLTRDEYIAACETMTPEAFYRSADGMNGKFVSLTLTVTEKITDADAYYRGDDYVTYYICKDESGSEFEIMIRDCIQDDAQNFIAGDIITVYGEGAGNVSIYDMAYNLRSAPCLDVAYVTDVK